MRIRVIAIVAALAALAGCDRIAAAVGAAPANSEPAADAAATEGEASSEWIELMGAWAPAGACGDVAQEWRIDAEFFQRGEMFCRIEKLELIKGGVRAISQCVVEGDDDHVADVFQFVRRPDYTLSVVNEANDAATDGLVACSDDMIP